MAETQTADTQSAPAPLAGSTLALTSGAIALGTFMQVLDATIANVSIPTISGNLGVSVSQGTWVITSFAVANGVSVPLTGWLMGRYGVVKTFVAAVTLFTIASFLCGIAWSLPSLIVFRILQGAVSGPMSPGSQALLIMIFAPEKRGTALAIWSITTLAAPICGPILGGYISDNITWSWIFFINVPVGVFCALICWRGLRSRETATRKLPIDKTGFALLLVWVGALQIMFDTGKDADWFSSPMIITELIIAVVMGAAWVIWELTAPYPIVDLSLFKSRNFTLATITFCLGYAVFFGANLLLPLWLQTQMGYVATWAGLAAAPSGIVAVLFTPIAAQLLSRVDARWTATLSLVAFGLSYYLRSQYTSGIDFWSLVVPSLVMGVGMSTFFISMVTLVLNGLPQSQIPSASGLTNFARIVAGGFSASLATTVWERSATMHQTRLAEITGNGNSPVAQTLSQIHHAGLSAAQALGALAQQVSSQAFLLATVDFFRVMAILMIALIPLVWLTHKALGSGAPAAAD